MMDAIKPYLTAIKFGLAVVLLSISHFFAHRSGANSVKVEQAEEYKSSVEKGNQAAESLEVKKNEREIVYRTITKEVEKIVDRPVYRADCIDADGLRFINDALAGSSKPNAAMP